MTSAAAVGPVPRDGRTAVPALGLLELGRQLFEQGEYTESALSLQRRIRLAPHDAEARYLLGLSLLRTGHVARAAALLEPSRLARALDATVCLEVGEALMPTDPHTAHRWMVSAVWAAPDSDVAQRRLEETVTVLDGQARRTGRHRGERRRWWRRA
jgi:Flp pilus assembly protein TadD